jgi:hypothetical protein
LFRPPRNFFQAISADSLPGFEFHSASLATIDGFSRYFAMPE